ncbi:MAG TPA: aminomethyl-transferring glycine dehydrogenase subunit GcvPA [Candidatus Dormibacteraeota bacterium]|nr:aminomethyl-transferring glycine dehydrogenase subunit GcvPA [Candidatus Dormibacteraeota bacterium]
MGDYLPHTEAEIASMLGFIGLDSLDELFAAVPEALRISGGLALADGVPEPDVLDRVQRLAEANIARSDHLVCFAGGGAYDHEVPPVVKALAGRSEFVTSYTPYQPEVAQGVLQAVFEYQTMVARLAGLPVANASLYDGASALVEGVNLGVGVTGREGVWLSAGVHPHWRAVLATFAAGTGHQVEVVPLVDGRTAWPPLTGGSGAEVDRPGVVVVGYPNYLGCIEDLAEVRRLCDALGAVMVVVADPVSAGILRSPGEQGADVVVGEGQAFGTPLGFGGPYLGLFACTLEHVRRLPGRLVGETVDSEGTRAYVTTLRAREQDIRREKATSNVCTNQTLMAVTAAVQLGWLGTSGLAEVALRSARGTRYCREALAGVDGVTPLTAATPVVREFAVLTPTPARTVVRRLAEDGFLAGLALADLVGEGGDGSVGPEQAEHGLLVAVTERRTAAEIDAFVAALDKAVRS